MPDIDLSTHLAACLLDIGAVRLRPENPFRWSSGWLSPIYCDNRLTLSFPALRTEIRDGLVALVQRQFPAAEAIAGVATAGIPQGVLVADRLGLPFLYVRSQAKGHGMENLLEGRVVTGQRVVVVEDLVSTGGSSAQAVAALRAGGLHVEGLVAIFTYGFAQAAERFAAEGVPVATLSDYETLLAVARQRALLTDAQWASLQAWRADPAAWQG